MATGRISDIMVKQPHCLKEGDSVLQAAKIMKDSGIGVIPVIDENRKPCGIVTDRDLVIRCIAESHDFKGCNLGSVISRNVQKVYEDQDINDAIDLMKRSQLHRLICVDRNDKLCGLLSLSDLAHTVKDNNLLGDLVRQIHREKGQSNP